MNKYIVEMIGICKRYPSNGVVALDHADLRVRDGSIHALVGENGAGKTTLMKVLCGFVKEDAGEIWLKGKKVCVRDPAHAFSLGIGMVHQHFKLIEDFTVAENVVLGVEPTRGYGFVSRRDMYSVVTRISEESGLKVDPYTKVCDLPMGERQKVELLKVLYRNVDVIILDEPTSVLTEDEVENLFRTMRMLKAKGKTIIFITHRLNEVTEISDEITVLRNGKTVKIAKTSEISESQISYAMVGEEISVRNHKSPSKLGERVILRVQDLHVGNNGIEIVKGISFDIRAGEIVGVAGIAGNGQHQMVEAIFGIRRPSKGKVLINGKNVTSSTPRAHREAGMAYIPDDRMGEASCGMANIMENLIADRYHDTAFSHRGWIDINFAKTFAKTLVSEFNIGTHSIDSNVGELSGGNIQKTIIARELSSDPDLLIVCEPAYGLDVRSTKFIYDTLLEMKRRHKAILLVSTNLDEILSLSNRILVIYKGKIVATFDNDVESLTKTEIYEYMMGRSYMDTEGLKRAYYS